jgi:ubiquitin-protein ligase
MSRRYERLYVEYERLKFLFANHPKIRIVEVSGDPPDHYVVEYRVRGLVETKTGVEIRGEHRVQITLGPNYPNEAPYCAMLTPVFHPNIDGFKICTEDVTPAGRRLDQIIVFVGRLIAFQAYNLSSPRNGAARVWAEQHLASFPLETFELLPQAIQDGSPLPVFRGSDIPVPEPPQIPPEPVANVNGEGGDEPAWSEPDPSVPIPPFAPVAEPAPQVMRESGPFPESHVPLPNPPRAVSAPCANCAAETAEERLRQCEMGHLVCPDCSLPCAKCGRELCALCAPASCQQCSTPLCAACGVQCTCGTVLCAAHSRPCAICGRPLCWGCLALCGGCGLLCCRTHLDSSGRCSTCVKRGADNPAADRSPMGDGHNPWKAGANSEAVGASRAPTPWRDPASV